MLNGQPGKVNAAIGPRVEFKFNLAVLSLGNSRGWGQWKPGSEVKQVKRIKHGSLLFCFFLRGDKNQDNNTWKQV